MKIAQQVVLGAAMALAAFGQSSAQDWPTRSVTVVVPIPAGVASDIIYDTLRFSISAACFGCKSGSVAPAFATADVVPPFFKEA